MRVYIDANVGRTSAYVLAPFDEAKKSLEEARYEIISLEENAKLRVQEKRDYVLSKCACRNCAGRVVKISNVSDSGNWLREGMVYVPKRGMFLTKKSPIMNYPEEATECHRRGVEFFLTDEQIEEALSDSIEIKAKLTSLEIPRTNFITMI